MIGYRILDAFRLGKRATPKGVALTLEWGMEVALVCNRGDSWPVAKLFTDAQHAQLLENGRQQALVRGTDAEIDFWPVVKLFDPFGPGIWLLTELEADDPDIAWGLCGPGDRCPEFGRVRLSEFTSILAPGLEHDPNFEADKPISAYCKQAWILENIRA